MAPAVQSLLSGKRVEPSPCLLMETLLETPMRRKGFPVAVYHDLLPVFSAMEKWKILV